jgi:hypothetical protein
MFRSRRNRVQEAGLCCFHVVGSSPDLSRVSPPVPRWSQSSLFHDSVPVNFCTRSSSRMPKPRANARNPSHSLVTILDRRRIVARKFPLPLIPHAHPRKPGPAEPGQQAAGPLAEQLCQRQRATALRTFCTLAAKSRAIRSRQRASFRASSCFALALLPTWPADLSKRLPNLVKRLPNLAARALDRGRQVCGNSDCA